MQIAYADIDKETIQLQPEDFAKVQGIISDYKSKEGSLMPILQKINATYNYLPMDLLRYVGRELDIPLSHIYNIATFYNAFSLVPKGKYTIALCRGTACHVRGSGRLQEKVEQELGISDGGTTEDFLFSLQTVRCIGCCSIAPAVRIGRNTYGNVRVNEIGNILRKYRL
ncbi:MAG TPA: NAD(P)H-dependent oxidoreductase subunit E [bacterium]